MKWQLVFLLLMGKWILFLHVFVFDYLLNTYFLLYIYDTRMFTLHRQFPIAWCQTTSNVFVHKSMTITINNASRNYTHCNEFISHVCLRCSFFFTNVYFLIGSFFFSTIFFLPTLTYSLVHFLIRTTSFQILSFFALFSLGYELLFLYTKKVLNNTWINFTRHFYTNKYLYDVFRIPITLVRSCLYSYVWVFNSHYGLFTYTYHRNNIFSNHLNDRLCIFEIIHFHSSIVYTTVGR